MLSIKISVFISNANIIAVDNRACGALCSLQHNVFKFRFSWNHGGGGDDSAQDIHQPSNRDVHFWQNYHSIFAEKYSNNIRKSVNQEPPTKARTHLGYTHTQ